MIIVAVIVVVAVLVALAVLRTRRRQAEARSRMGLPDLGVVSADGADKVKASNAEARQHEQ